MLNFTVFKTLPVLLALAPEHPSPSLEASITYVLQPRRWQLLSLSFVMEFDLEKMWMSEVVQHL